MATRCLSLGAAVALFARLATAGGDGEYEVTKWMTTTCWETEKQEKFTTFYDTVWSTEYQTSYIEVTTTEYKTVPTTETVFETAYSTVTETAYDTVSDTLTETQTAVQISGVTNTETAISIATETAAITSIDVVVTTVYETINPEVAPPVTVTACPPTSTLERIVLCPSRTSKAAQKSFPTNYLWGCPPGKICKPKQVDCNFEQNVPEAGYYCDPADGDECIETPPLPPYTDSETNYTCGNLLDPAPGYFDFDPHLFGLDFSIYNFGGQVAKPCETPAPPPPAPPSPSKSYSPEPIYSPSEWKSWSPPAPSPDISSEWQVWSPPAVTPSPYEPAKDSEWQQWNGPSVLPASKTWGSWSEPHVTPRAILGPRQGSDIVPGICMDKCQQCIRHGERAGYDYDQLCVSGVDFQNGFTACANCVESNKASFPRSIPPLLPSLVQFLNWCSENPPTSTVQVDVSPTQAEPVATTSVVTSVVFATSTPPPASAPSSESPVTTSASPPVVSPEATPTSSATTPTIPTVSVQSSAQGSVTLITSCNCVTITSTLAAGGPAASQISDGQVQAPTGPATFTGVASSVRPAESNWFLTLLLSLLTLFQI